MISLTSMMSYNNVMKILFLNNFSLMNSIKEELILQIMWTTAFFLVSSMLNIEKKQIKRNPWQFLFQLTASWMDCINITLESGKLDEDLTLPISLERFDSYTEKEKK